MITFALPIRDVSKARDRNIMV